MAIFTEGLIIRQDRNILDDVVTGQFDAASTAASEAFVRNPLSSAIRNVELTRAEQGPVVSHGAPAWGVDQVRAEPETPMLTAEQARARVKDAGLDLSIDDAGIREGALDILMERKQEEMQRQWVLSNAPPSTVPIQLLAGFAASMVDPINIASAFVPIFGEARYTAMLASATTRAARAGVRARVGAVQGGVGAALVEPIVLSAAMREQADYDMVDSLTNVAFGTVLGGGLHAAGGAISDLRRSRLINESASEPEIPLSVPEGVEATPSSRRDIDAIALAGDESPMSALRAQLERSIEADRPRMMEAARMQAMDDMAPAIRKELEDIIAGKPEASKLLRQEASSIDSQLEQIDSTFRARAKEFQSQRMTRKQAERAARDAIAQERESLVSRRAEIDQGIQENRSAAQAREDLTRLNKGEIPERYRQQIDDAASESLHGLQLRGAARFVAENAPWAIRANAMKAAVAQMATGRPVDVEAIFNLSDPALRKQSIEKMMGEATRPSRSGLIDADAEAASRSADDVIEAGDGDDLGAITKMMDDEFELTMEIADQAGIDLNAQLRDADALVRDADSFAAAYRAAAICQLRN